MSTPQWAVRHRLLKSAYKAQKRWRRALRDEVESLYYRYNVARAHRALRRSRGPLDAAYDAYLREQLEETLHKKRFFGRRRFDQIPLIDMLVSRYDVARRSVLCIGCRNDDEIRCFRKRGAGPVIGIDLYDAPPDIVRMDMHELQFPDAAFDVVYSRHSFEHAYDRYKAAREFVRVVKPGGVIVVEVPGRMQGGGDRSRFDGIDEVVHAFAGHVGEFLWKEYSRKEDNADKMDIIRVMFRVEKKD